MLAWFVSLFGGSLISSLVNGAISAYKAKLESVSSTEAHAVDLAKAEILGEIAARQAATQIIIAEQGWWPTAIIRPLFAFPLIVYFNKTILWDKVLGWGSTDPLTGMIGDWAGWIIVAYFGGRSIEKVARIFRR